MTRASGEGQPCEGCLVAHASGSSTPPNAAVSQRHELQPNGDPRGVSFAQHRNNDPGEYRSWAAVRRLGEHPIVLSARGTHASYPDQRSVAWFDRASGCVRVDGCADAIWRTWEGGGLLNVGERGAMLGAGEALAYDGLWGGSGRFLRARAAPRGPVWQRAFHSGGFD